MCIWFIPAFAGKGAQQSVPCPGFLPAGDLVCCHNLATLRFWANPSAGTESGLTSVRRSLMPFSAGLRRRQIDRTRKIIRSDHFSFLTCFETEIFVPGSLNFGTWALSFSKKLGSNLQKYGFKQFSCLPQFIWKSGCSFCRHRRTPFFRLRVMSNRCLVTAPAAFCKAQYRSRR